MNEPATPTNPTVRHIDWSGPSWDANYKWPMDVVADLKRVSASARTSYRGAASDPLARARLTKAGFFGEAYVRGRLDRAAWLGTVLPARTGSQGGEAYEQVGFKWTRTLWSQIEDDFDELDAASAMLWGPGFRLTRAHMVLACIQHGLKDRDDWLLSPSRRLSLRRESTPDDDLARIEDFWP